MEYKLLESIESPKDLKKLSIEELINLSSELRAFILESVSRTGGHLASNLGSIELTIALHYVYNAPDDLLVWDVGHQTYAHKILTGRLKDMANLRTYKGLSGFPSRCESKYDTFGVGHSSTSISAALGMATANQMQNIDSKVVAIIGDGAMSAGLAFEGLNNAGWLKKDMLVVLNDNEMSISENVGAINKYLSSLLAGRFYNSIKNSTNKTFKKCTRLRNFAHKLEEHIKGMFMPGTIFEEFGFNYIGPIDGHDIPGLVSTLSKVKHLSGPQFLHVITKKGQGYKLAQNDPIKYHGVTKFNPSNGAISPTGEPKKMTYTQVFGAWLCDMADIHKNFVAITPAMREGSGMATFASKYKDRFFDVAIAEQHALTFAAGVATQNIKPVVAIYSTFLQRGYDQLIHDIALQNLPVMFAIDRASIVGADGPTHNGVFDISYLRCIPNMIIMTPSDEIDLYHMLTTALLENAICAIRYPRALVDCYNLDHIKNKNKTYKIGVGQIIRNSSKQADNARVAILSFGTLLGLAKEVANEIDATAVDMRFVKPIDKKLLLSIASNHDLIVTLEEGVICGGAGSYCGEILQENSLNKPMIHLGFPDKFIEQGDASILMNKFGLTKNKIVAKIKDRLQQMQK